MIQTWKTGDIAGCAETDWCLHSDHLKSMEELKAKGVAWSVKAAALECERDDLRAENARLREELEGFKTGMPLSEVLEFSASALERGLDYYWISCASRIDGTDVIPSDGCEESAKWLRSIAAKVGGT